MIGIEHRRAPRLNAGKDFGLGPGNAIQRAESLQMRRGYRGDHRDMGPHQLRQRPDFIGSAHAHFEHAELRAFGQARQH